MLFYRMQTKLWSLYSPKNKKNKQNKTKQNKKQKQKTKQVMISFQCKLADCDLLQ